ncbi:TonB-dependent receptor [bacterium]|nr:MAG: TonB-dependent receptor [bacterium]
MPIVRELRLLALPATLTFLFSALAPGAPALAQSQSDSGTVAIAVVDAHSQAPVAGARVILQGPILTSEIAGANGKVTFTDVPSGIYTARVAKIGFQAATSKDFEVLPGRSVALSVALAPEQAPGGLKIIGRITVTSQPAPGTNVIGADSPVRKLSDDLAQAIGKLPGVTLDDGAGGADTDAAETISLDGHDASQTAVTLDGIPLNAPGQAANLRSFSTDLFSGASVNHSPVAGALGGGVNFRTLEPTLTWQGQITSSVGSYGNANTILSERGTVEGIGIAYVHAVRGSDNLLYGDRFLDTSGLDYPHDGSRLNGGDLVKLRAHLGAAQTLTVTYLSSNTYNNLLCTTDTGALPCGYGPGNAAYGHHAMASLTDSALVGMVGLQFAVYGINGTHDSDLLDRYLNGTPDPYGVDTTQQTRGASLTASLPSRGKHTFSIQGTTSRSTNSATPIIAQTGTYVIRPASTSDYTSFTLNDSVKASAHLRLGEQIGLANATGSGSSLVAGTNVTWSPTVNDIYTAELDLGNTGATPSRVGILTDPAGLRFDCGGGIAYGTGPGDEPSSSSSYSVRSGWQHLFRHGDVTATIYRQQQNGTLIPTPVNATALAPGYFPPGYFGQAQQVFNSAGGCGQTGVFAPNDLYLTVPIAGVTRVYQGIQLGGQVGIGPSLVLQGSYTVQSSMVRSSDPRLNSAYSTVISGNQLPGVPLHRAAVLLDYKPPRSAVEMLADAQYTSAGNAQNLPAYLTVDAGITIQLQHGTLSLLGTNLGDTHGGIFATTGGVPLTTLGGTLLPTIERPLTPRNISVTYSVPIGPHGQAARASTSSLSASAGPGGRRERGAFFQPLPPAPPSSPFAVDASRPSCPADVANEARPILDALQGYVSSIERAKTAAGYPAQPPADAPSIPGLETVYHQTGDSYAVALVATQIQSVRALARCATVHVADESEAQQHGLYIPPRTPFGGFALAFSPRAGLYAVRRPPAAGQEQFRLYRLPTTPPAYPFAVETRSTCTSELRQVAAPLLDALAQYAANFDPADPPARHPEGWQVTPKQQSSTWWLEAQLANIQAVPAILNCAHVSVASSDELKARNEGGATPPTLNYAPALGLYIVRNGGGARRGT